MTPGFRRGYRSSEGEAARRANAALRKGLGLALSSQEKYWEAEPIFERLCRDSPRDVDHCYYLGRVRFTVGDFAGSATGFESALKTGQRMGRTWHGLALTLDRAGDSSGAEKAYRKALALDHAAAATDYGRFLAGLGRIDEATAVFRKYGLTGEAARAEAARVRRPGISPAHVRFSQVDLPNETRNGAYGRKHLPETMLAGVTVFDFDADGRPDIFIPNGAALPSLKKDTAGFADRLYRNTGNRAFVDHTKLAGVGGDGYSMNGAAGDFDGDGRLDLFVAGVTSSRLYRNEGEGVFRDVTRQAGLPEASPWAVAAVWLDYDGDRLLDLFVVRYVQWDPRTEPSCQIGDHRTYCHPRHYQPLSNSLYRNRGDGTFADVSSPSGIAKVSGKGMGAAIHDVDGNGWPDIFVANDTLPNFLFLNLGAGVFREAGVEAGVALKDDGAPISSMGAAFADVDGDGAADFLVSALSDETFPVFRASGAGRFEDAGLATRIASLSRPYTGWGVGTADFNADGFPDFAVACGHVQDNAERFSARPSRQPVVLFLNRGNGTFEKQEIGEPSFYRGLAVADFDQDGRPDLVVTRLNQKPILFFNEGPVQKD